MSDWTQNLLSTSKANLPDLLRDYAESAIIMDPTSDTNIPTGAIRYRPNNRLIERWSGAAWQDLGSHLGTTGGGSNNLSLTPTVPLLAYGTGQRFTFYASLSTTLATTTINISSLGAKNIKKYGGGALYDVGRGDIIIGGLYEIFYDGTQFILLNPAHSSLTRQVLLLTHSNSAAEITKLTRSIKGNTIDTSGSLRLKCYGDIGNASGSALTTTFRVKFGASVVFNCVTAALASGANYGWEIEVVLNSAETLTNQRSSGKLFVHAGSSNSGDDKATTVTGATNNITETTTSDLDLVVTAQMDVASVNAICSIYGGTVELV